MNLKGRDSSRIDLTRQPLQLRINWVRKYLAPLVRAKGAEFEREMSRAIGRKQDITVIPERFRQLIEEAERRKIAAEGEPVAGEDFPMPVEEGLLRLVEAVRGGSRPEVSS